MAIGPVQGKPEAFSQIGKLMQGKNEAARQSRLKPQGRVDMDSQRVRSSKSSRKQQMKEAQKRRDQRGESFDVRA
jgi:hypothetical protein